MLQRIRDDRNLKAGIADYQKQEQHHKDQASRAATEIRQAQAQLDRGKSLLERTPRTPSNTTAVHGLARDCVLCKHKLAHAQKRHDLAVYKASQAKNMANHLSEQRRQLHAKPAALAPGSITAEALMAAHLLQGNLDDAFELLQQADARAAMTPADLQEVEDLLRGYAPAGDILAPSDAAVR